MKIIQQINTWANGKKRKIKHRKSEKVLITLRHVHQHRKNDNNI